MAIRIGIGGILISISAQVWTQPIVIIKSGDIWYKREINFDDGYFALWYSDDAGVTWDFLFSLDLTEDNVVIDLIHNYRHRVVGTQYRVDRTMTSIGYAGIEGTDWENLYST